MERILLHFNGHRAATSGVHALASRGQDNKRNTAISILKKDSFLKWHCHFAVSVLRRQTWQNLTQIKWGFAALGQLNPQSVDWTISSRWTTFWLECVTTLQCLSGYREVRKLLWWCANNAWQKMWWALSVIELLWETPVRTYGTRRTPMYYCTLLSKSSEDHKRQMTPFTRSDHSAKRKERLYIQFHVKTTHKMVHTREENAILTHQNSQN